MNQKQLQIYKTSLITKQMKLEAEMEDTINSNQYSFIEKTKKLDKLLAKISIIQNSIILWDKLVSLPDNSD